MKLKAPEGLCSVSLNSEAVELAEDGTVEVQGAANADALKAHGFTEVKVDPARPKVAKTKAEK